MDTNGRTILSEDYCSFEVAKLLKEKGFDEPCDNYYDKDSISKEQEPQELTWDEIIYSFDNFLRAPTHQMAMKWLREVHNLFICIEFDAPTFVADIHKMDEIDEYGCAKHIQPTIANCKTYEKAVEAALKYVLENLI